VKPLNDSVSVLNALTGMAIAQQTELTDDRFKAYFELLQDIPAQLLKRMIMLACRYTKAPPGTLPTVGEIRSYLEQAQRQLDRENTPARLRTPTPLGSPDPHECHAEVAMLRAEQAKPPRERKKLLLGSARGFLANLNSYEAWHVKCGSKGEIHPVCPSCGRRWEHAVINPVIVELAKLFPAETADWSPYHKGLMLCETCAEGWKP